MLYLSYNNVVFNPIPFEPDATLELAGSIRKDAADYDAKALEMIKEKLEGKYNF